MSDDPTPGAGTPESPSGADPDDQAAATASDTPVTSGSSTPSRPQADADADAAGGTAGSGGGPAEAAATGAGGPAGEAPPTGAAAGRAGEGGAPSTVGGGGSAGQVGGGGSRPPGGGGGGGGVTVGDLVRGVAIAAAVGSAVIHFALAPAHLDERTADGVFFLVVAWAQVAAALALARWRDRPEPWMGAGALNAAVLLVWAGSRTVGFPESHHTSIGFPDTLAGVLEVVVVLAAVAALRPATARRTAPVPNPLLAGACALALVGLVSASVSPSLAGEAAGHGHEAGDHAHGDGGDHTGGHGDGDHAHGDGGAQAAVGSGHGAHGAAGEQVPDDERCDLGFNTAAYNDDAVPGRPHAHADGTPVDFTIEEWADVFVDTELGIPTDAVLGFLDQNPLQRDAILTGSLTHSLDPDPWNALTDEAECEQLAQELADAKQVAATYPTVADAEAAGYAKVTDYLPGIAAHYINYGYIDGEFVLEEPEMLLYDGTDPDSHMVGLSYYIFREGDEEPTQGFTGDNDHYHRHTGLCFREGVVVGGSNTTDEECASLGGAKQNGADGWMSHVWIVPGCESDWGVFSGANPALPVLRGVDGWDSGCGSGLTMDDPLAFETGGNGPQELATG